MRRVSLVAIVLSVVGCSAGRPFFPPEELPPIPPTPPPERTTAEQFSNSRRLEIAVPREKAVGMSRVELWYSVDGGESWRHHDTYPPEQEFVPFNAPQDGGFLFVFAPVDRAGERAFTPRHGVTVDASVVVDTVLPVVSVRSPNGGELFSAGRPTVVSWIAEDANLGPAPVSLEFSSEGGAAWVPVERNLPNSGRFHWQSPPTTSNACRIRVRVRDLAGNESETFSAGVFTVDGLPPAVQLHAHAAATKVPVEIRYTALDPGGAGVAQLVLWITEDGGRTWRRAQERGGNGEPFQLEVVDGTYGLWISARDRVGNETPSPASGAEPMHTVTLDSAPPAVQIGEPRGGLYMGGTDLAILYAARDNVGMPVRAITLEFTLDGGRTWQLITQDAENTGAFVWRLPATASDACRLRIRAADLLGNVAAAESDAFAIDVAVPTARAVAPARSARSPADVEYEIRQAGRAPVTQVTLWYRAVGARLWNRYAEDPDRQSPIPFHRADGDYEIVVTCATELGSRSGLRQGDPGETTAPDLTLSLDTAPPVVELGSFNNGGAFQAGATYDILWSYRDEHADPEGVTIEYSPDGGASWQTVASRVDPAEGRLPWRVPETGGRVHLLRVYARDRFGLTSQATSAYAFRIDIERPVVRIVQTPPPRLTTRAFRVHYEAGDDAAGIERVEAWARPESSGAAYSRLGQSDRPVGSMDLTLPGDGSWEVVVIATDGVGRRSLEIETAPAEFRVLADTQPPEVHLVPRVASNGRTVYVDDNFALEWTAVDALTPADQLGIRVEYSTDGGASWLVAVSRMPNTGRHPVDDFLRPSVPARVRAVATDEVGNEGRAESEDFDIAWLPSAELALEGLTPGTEVFVGRTLPLRLRIVRGPVVRTAVDLRPSAGEWRELGPVQAEFPFTVPAQEGEYEVRARATERFGRSITSTPIRFRAVLPPRPVITLSPPARPEIGVGAAVDLQWEITGTPVESLEVLVQEPGGPMSLWRVLGPAAQQVTYTVGNSEGECRARIDGVDAWGRRTPSNEVTFRIAPPPEAELTFEIVPARLEYAVGSMVELRWRANQELTEVRLVREATGTWETLLALPDPTTRYRVRTREARDVLAVEAIDRRGRVVRSNRLTVITVMVAPPAVEITVYDGGGDLQPGDSLLVHWGATDVTRIAEAWLQWNRDGEWQTTERFSGDQLFARVPERPGSYRLRVRAVDSLEREVFSEEVAIRVAVTERNVPAQLLPPTAAPEGVVRIRYQLPDARATRAGLRVEIARQLEEQWSTVPIAEEDEETVRFFAPTQPGSYLVRVVLAEGPVQGKSDPLPLEVVGGAQPPVAAALRLSNFRGGELYAGGRTLPILIEHAAEIALEIVTVELSSESGAEGTWREIPRARLQPLDRGQGFYWTLPRLTGSTFRIRLSARGPEGEPIQDGSERDFGIDSTPPTARVSRPEGEIPATGPITLREEVRPSLAPVEEKILYVTTDNGVTWSPTARFGAADPVVFLPPAPGTYGLYLAARSSLGFVSGEPAPGTAPQDVIAVNAPPPAQLPISIELVSSIPGRLRGGAAPEIRWRGGPQVDTSVAVYVVADGEVIATVVEGAAPTGRATWRVPRIQRTGCTVRVVIRRGAEEKVVESTPFEIRRGGPSTDEVEIQEGQP